MIITEQDREKVSPERLHLAIETLGVAFKFCFIEEDKFLGAIEQQDPSIIFTEAMRNLTAFCNYLHGEEEWKKLLSLRY